MPSDKLERRPNRVTVVRDGDSVAVFGDDQDVTRYVDGVLQVLADAKQANPIRTQDLADLAAGASADVRDRLKEVGRRDRRDPSELPRLFRKDHDRQDRGEPRDPA